MSVKYIRKTDRLNRSFDNFNLDGASNPWKLLAAAVIFQAAVDCSQWNPEIEQPCYNSSKLNGLPYRRKGKLTEFINSDWVDTLLCWQTEIKADAVREELIRRLNR